MSAFISDIKVQISFVISLIAWRHCRDRPVTRSETSLYNTAVIPSLWKCKYMVQNNKNDCEKEEKQKLIYIS